MHMLHLLRHAKSSWKDDVEDHKRQLNRRGREAAQRISQHLPDIGRIDLVLCSSAVRTRETLELVLDRLEPQPSCLIEDGLYLAECDKLIERIARLDEALTSVLVVGHNPGLHQFAVALAEPCSSRFAALANKFPTLARASFNISTRWSEIGSARHRLVDYVTPGSPSGDAN